MHFPNKWESKQIQQKTISALEFPQQNVNFTREFLQNSIKISNSQDNFIKLMIKTCWQLCDVIKMAD